MELNNILLDGAGHVVLADRPSMEFKPRMKVNLISILSVGESTYSNT
jgi:hypothetical protein